MTLLVDSHCHLNFPEFRDGFSDMLKRAWANGVRYLLCVSVNLEDREDILRLAQEHWFIFGSVGVHPNIEYSLEGEPDIEQLVTISNDSQVIAIGETGLDYYRSTGALDWQRNRFRTHIRAAKISHRPLIVHSREARKDTISILKEEGAETVGGVMHCFSEDWTTARAALDLGFYISFSGIVTFRNAGDLREVAKKVPDDRILIETDAPFLAPAPMRGRTNEPAYVRHTAAAVSNIRSQSLEVFSAQSTENFFRLFGTATRVREKETLGECN